MSPDQGSVIQQGSYTNHSQMTIHPPLLGSPIPVEEPQSFTPNPSDDAGCPTRFIRRALNIFLESDLTVPEPSRLVTIVKAALEAQHAFFSAALFEPAQLDLDSVFDSFVMSCAQQREAAHSGKGSDGALVL
jgi:hypothetical protein